MAATFGWWLNMASFWLNMASKPNEAIFSHTQPTPKKWWLNFYRSAIFSHIKPY
jgi:hypothetical protein